MEQPHGDDVGNGGGLNGTEEDAGMMNEQQKTGDDIVLLFFPSPSMRSQSSTLEG